MEIWILGATGRAGRAIAGELARRDQRFALVGRSRARLSALAGELGGGPETLIVDGEDGLASAMAARAPAVVINAVGPYRVTAVSTASLCLARGVHYVDLANELEPVIDLLALDTEAAEAGCTLVTGAGFGVAAAEALAIALRGDRPPAARARVAAIPIVSGLGRTAVASLLDAISSGGRRYVDGQLESCPLGAGFALTPLPDGSSVGTVAVATGDLEAVRRASGAANVIAAAGGIPSAGAIRALLPALARLIAIAPVRRGLLAATGAVGSRLPSGNQRDVSWAHAELTWPDGSCRQGWLRTGEGYGFTAAVATEVACAIVDGRGRPGAHTPVSLLGVAMVEQAGARLILNQADR